MDLPFRYPFGIGHEFGGARPVAPTFGDARVVVLPVPLERSTSYVPGTRNGPREILLASSHMELWDEELGIDVHGVGIFTVPEMEFPSGTTEEALEQIRLVTHEIVEREKFPVILGGEHSITVPAVAAMAAHHPDLTLLQIDAHADLRESYAGDPHSHACAVRGSLRHVTRATQVGIRSLSPEEAEAAPTLPTTIFYDVTMRQNPDWIDRVIESLSDTVYVTIDCDALDPAIMPAVGTPEPGGLSWYELLALMRAVTAKRLVVGFDLVELCPIPGIVAPNFLCAKLVYKILAYQFAERRHHV
ncbi:MAG: agmatinase [Vicinamibacterales bacterium]